MRVVHFDHSGLPGGGQLGLRRFVTSPGLRLGHNVVVLKGGEVTESIREAGVDVRDVGLTTDGLRELILKRKRVESIVALGEPDLILANSLRAAVSLALTRKRTAWAYYVRQDMSAASMGRLQRLFFLALVAPRFDALVANSEWTMSTAPSWLRKSRTTAIAPPLSGIARFLDVSRETQMPDGSLRVGWLGRIAHWKGLHVLLDALDMITESRARIRIQIAGGAYYSTDRYVAQVNQRVSRSQHQVELLGHIDDVPTFLANQDVLAHTSINPEPFGQVIVQGMAAGIPVIATDAGGAAAIIEDGVDGILVPPNHAPSLAEALVKLAHDGKIARSIGEAARLKAQRLYADDTLAANLEDFLESAARDVKFR